MKMKYCRLFCNDDKYRGTIENILSDFSYTLVQSENPDEIPNVTDIKFILINYSYYLSDVNVLNVILALYKDTPKVLIVRDPDLSKIDDADLKNVYGVIAFPLPDNSLRLILQNTVKLIDGVIESEISRVKLKLATQTFELLNFNENIDDIISDTLFLVKSFLNYDAIAVRLKTENHFEYTETIGFSDNFIASESVVKNKDCLSCTHNCFCGVVLNDGMRHNSNYSTPYGSFWTNNFLTTINQHVEEFSDIKIKGTCLKCGYNSVALIPIKHDDIVLGMFQINCYREDAFTVDDIRFFERISTSIGVSIFQKETKKLLEKSEKALNRAQNIAKISSWTNEGQGEDDKYFISENIEDVLGIKPTNGTVTLQQIVDVTHEDDKAFMVAQRTKARINGLPYSYDFRIRFKDDVRYMHLAAEPVIEQGKIVAFAGIVQDITQRRIAQEALEENNKFLDHVLQGIGAAIIIVDPIANQIRYVNHAAEELLKVTADEMVGTSCHGLLCNNEKTDLCTSEDNHSQTDFILTRKNGEQVSTLRTIIKVHWKGSLHHAMIFFDMTERKNLEIQLSHAQKMESIGHLAAGIAHEINTPIQYVGDNVSFLQHVLSETLDVYRSIVDSCKNDGYPDCPVRDEICKTIEDFDFEFYSSESKEAFEQTLDGIDRVSKIVKAMRTFSHPGSSEKNLIDINKSLETTIIISRNEWKYTCTVETDFEQDMPEIYGYHDDLNQVFLNMIINASHAIEEKFKSKSKLGLIKIKTETSGNKIIISISDNGMGISKENLSKIFNPFFTTKTVGKGTGQGLSICHSIIVDKHEGHIDLQSKEGEGTTFIITLPIS